MFKFPKLPTVYLAALFVLLSIPQLYASEVVPDLSKKDALDIIATFDELAPRHYQINHIMDGTQETKDGFRHYRAKRISYMGPKNNQDTRRVFLTCTMLYTQEYGWFLQRHGNDARGCFLEISSQKRGRIFIR